MLVRSCPPEKLHLQLCCAVQGHMAREAAPISDYVTDLRGVLDNTVRVLQALIDLAADAGFLSTALVTMSLVQALTQVASVNLILLHVLPVSKPVKP